MCGTEPLQPMASDHIASYLEPSLWCIYLHVSSLMHASQKVTHCAFLKWKELHFFSYLKVSDSLGWMDSLFWNFKLPDSPWQYGCLSHHCLVMQQISLETSSMPWDVHSAIEKIWYKKIHKYYAQRTIILWLGNHTSYDRLKETTSSQFLVEEVARNDAWLDRQHVDKRPQTERWELTASPHISESKCS